MLEQVGRARVSHSLVAAAHAVDDRERGDGRDVIGEQQRLEAVRAKPKLADARLFPDEIERGQTTVYGRFVPVCDVFL